MDGRTHAHAHTTHTHAQNTKTQQHKNTKTHKHTKQQAWKQEQLWHVCASALPPVCRRPPQQLRHLTQDFSRPAPPNHEHQSLTSKLGSNHSFGFVSFPFVRSIGRVAQSFFRSLIFIRSFGNDDDDDDDDDNDGDHHTPSSPHHDDVCQYVLGKRL